MGLTSCDQSVIDAGAYVVHASTRSDFGGEGQQELDEATSYDDFLGEFGLLIKHGDDKQGKLCGVVAITNLSEEGREAFLTNIEGEFPGLRGIGIGKLSSAASFLLSIFSANWSPLKFCTAFVALGRTWTILSWMLIFTSFIMWFSYL